LGIIRRRKHPAVGFRLERNAAGFKPVDRVPGLKPGERPAKRGASARIESDQLGGIETSVRHIAAAAPGDSNFTQNLRGPFQKNNPACRIFLRAGNGREKPGRAAADDNDLRVLWIRWHESIVPPPKDLTLKKRQGANAALAFAFFKRL